jgi:hypothetical protein
MEKPLQGADLQSFAQRMRSRVAAAGRERPVNGSGRASLGSPPKRHDVPPPGDDDIPF